LHHLFIPVDECIYFPTSLSFDIVPAAETHIEQLRRDESWLEEMDIICAASATKAKSRDGGFQVGEADVSGLGGVCARIKGIRSRSVSISKACQTSAAH
jgi:hypothetical protein